MTDTPEVPQPGHDTAEVRLEASVTGAGVSVQGGRDASAVIVHGSVVRSTIVVGNNNTVTGAAALFTLDPISPKQAVPASAGPAALLDPRYEVVPFVPTAAHATLTRWLTEPGARSACLISAPGGYGKTRLAWQICRDAELAGWRTVVATNSADLPAPTVSEADSFIHTEQILVFLDYADRWSRSDLQDLATGLAQLPGRTRLLLTSRSEAFWPIASRSLRSLGFQLSRVHLSDELEDSRAHYLAALHAYGNVLGLGDPESAMIDTLLPRTPNPALEIHVRALLTRLAEREPAGSIGPAWPELSRDLIERELDHWARMVKDPPNPVRTSLSTLFRATLFATLTRGLDYATAHRLLKDLGFDNIDDLIADHSALYPAPERTTVMWPLLPDRIGEDLLACSLSTAPDESFMPGWGGPACDRLVTALFALKKNIDIPNHGPVPVVESRLHSALAVLADTAERWPHARELLHDVVHSNPQLGILTSGPVMEKIAKHLPLSTLRKLVVALDDFAISPVGGINLTLHNSWVEVLSVVCEDERFEDLPAHERIQILDDLTQTMMHSGRFDEALSCSLRMMRLVLKHWVSTDFESDMRVEPREVELEPDIDRLRAIQMITHHASRCSAADQLDVGLYWSMTAVHLARKIAPEDPIHFSVVSTYANALADTGDLDGAIEWEQNLLAWLMHRDCELDEFDRRMIAATQHNLGSRLLRKHDYDQARVLLKQAVAIRLQLHEEMPWLFGPEVAESVHNLAVVEHRAGHLDEALTLVEQALAIRRNMVKAVPQSFARQLLGSMRVLIRIHIDRGSTAQAFELNDEYLAEWRRAVPQLGNSAVALLLDGLDSRLALLHRANRIGEFPVDVERLLLGTSEQSPFAESSQGSIVLRLAERIIRTNPQIAIELTQTYSAVLQQIVPEAIDANAAVFVALGSATEKAFDATTTALEVLVRSRGSGDIDDWVEKLKPQYLDVIPQVLHQWCALRTSDDKSGLILRTAISLIPLLRAAASNSNETKDTVAEVAHLSAVLGIQSREDSGIIELATLAVECYRELVAGGNCDSDRLLTTLNTLALSYLQGKNPDPNSAMDAAIQAVAIAEKRRERHRSATTDGDFAMCMENYARACAMAGERDRALQASRVGFSVRLSMVKAGGSRMLPTLLLGCRTAENLLVTIEFNDMVAVLWDSAAKSLGPELWQELQQLREQHE